MFSSSEVQLLKQKLNEVTRPVGSEIESAGLRHFDDARGTHLVSATSSRKPCTGISAFVEGIEQTDVQDNLPTDYRVHRWTDTDPDLERGRGGLVKQSVATSGALGVNDMSAEE